MDEGTYAKMAALQGQHWWYRGRAHILACTIRSLGLRPGARILDAGCGAGSNLAMLAEFGTVSAFEPHDASRDFARGLGVADVRFGTLPDGIPFSSDFDLVCAFDVLTHIEDDRGALRALAACCRPGGRVLITLPAQPWLWSEHDVRNMHFRRYTTASVRALAADCDLETERLTAFNSYMFPVVAGVRLAQRAFGMSNKAEESMPPPLINTILERIFRSEARTVCGSGFSIGVSILAILSPRRPAGSHG